MRKGRDFLLDWRLGAALAALGAGVLLALSLGSYPLGPDELFAWATARLSGQTPMIDQAAVAVIERVRGPRVLVAIVVGAALATAGAAYQGLFRNPLVSPDILGVSSGAALGAVLGIFLSLPIIAIQGMAFVGGLAAVSAVMLTAAMLRQHDRILVLVLGGIVIGTLFGSGVALLKVLADPYNQLPAITFWLLGSLAGVGLDELWSVAPAFLLGALPLLLLHWRLNVMTLGEEEARALGVETGRLRGLTVVCATLMTAAVVSVSGIVGWVGLLIPHLARFLVGPSFGRLLPTSALLGAAFLLLVDTAARSLGRLEIPLGVLTAIIGTPVFIWVLARSRRGWQ
ncbi:FecCD family ABC transporter permease [Aquibaculum arenosum]|uniref:Iron ABC transporter permease n=1 Tax=Aquibaculum arenosum TaxID=3032591 RepID=A0ABT5YN95_9PROT|nr:iron ABC transporter permease [Fodinicurvata sp. CAU 1616]MDF2096450.1 iron ABC transporter permease [Fodinicurvata sp. CAU 1616]